jgi:hypothetical protein
MPFMFQHEVIYDEQNITESLDELTHIIEALLRKKENLTMRKCHNDTPFMAFSSAIFSSPTWPPTPLFNSSSRVEFPQLTGHEKCRDELH